MQAFDTIGHTDVQSLAKFKEGMTVARLTILPAWMVKEIVEKGGQASCDGEPFYGICQTEYSVWLKFELIRENGELFLVDHSFKTKESVKSENMARQIIRGY